MSHRLAPKRLELTEELLVALGKTDKSLFAFESLWCGAQRDDHDERAYSENEAGDDHNVIECAVHGLTVPSIAKTYHPRAYVNEACKSPYVTSRDSCVETHRRLLGAAETGACTDILHPYSKSTHVSSGRLCRRSFLTRLG